MVAPAVLKIRTANLPHFRLSPKEASYLLSIVGLTNLVLGVLIGIML